MQVGLDKLLIGLLTVNNIGCWNTSGLNDPLKQVEVRNFITSNSLKIHGLVETRVQANNKDRIRNNIMHGWSYLDNYNYHDLDRICSDQSILAKASIMNEPWFVLTIVYGHNADDQREDLWATLSSFAINNCLPWCVLGDFNAYLYAHEKDGGSPVSAASMASVQARL